MEQLQALIKIAVTTLILLAAIGLFALIQFILK